MQANGNRKIQYFIYQIKLKEKLIPNQKVKVKWGSKNKKRLISFGYIFTKMGDEIEVAVEHLFPNSLVKIVYICDYIEYLFTHDDKFLLINVDI